MWASLAVSKREIGAYAAEKKLEEHGINLSRRQIQADTAPGECPNSQGRQFVMPESYSAVLVKLCENMRLERLTVTKPMVKGISHFSPSLIPLLVYGIMFVGVITTVCDRVFVVTVSSTFIMMAMMIVIQMRCVFTLSSFHPIEL